MVQQDSVSEILITDEITDTANTPDDPEGIDPLSTTSSEAGADPVPEKRRISKEFLPVDPLPSTIKKRKMDDEKLSNSVSNEVFLAKVRQEYLIKEGMQLVFIHR